MFLRQLCIALTILIAGPAPVSGLRAAPNPFTGSVTLFLVRPPDAALVPASVGIFDLSGRMVRELEVPAGREAVAWNGADNGGRPAAPGIYFVRVRAGGWSVSGKIVKTR